jgi:hypothetical protein
MISTIFYVVSLTSLIGLVCIIIAIIQLRLREGKWMWE